MLAIPTWGEQHFELLSLLIKMKETSMMALWNRRVLGYNEKKKRKEENEKRK